MATSRVRLEGQAQQLYNEGSRRARPRPRRPGALLQWPQSLHLALRDLILPSSISLMCQTECGCGLRRQQSERSRAGPSCSRRLATKQWYIPFQEPSLRGWRSTPVFTNASAMMARSPREQQPRPLHRRVRRGRVKLQTCTPCGSKFATAFELQTL